MLTCRLTLWVLIALTIIHEGSSRKHKWLRFGKSYFALMESQKTWAEAASKCDEIGGHLAEINSWIEALFIKIIVKDRNLNPPFVWLGGNDLVLEGHWKWEKSNHIISYTNWCPGDPNNLGSGENCLAMTGKCDWKWYDEPCTYAYNFLCENNIITCPHNWLRFGDSCFAIIDAKNTWAEAAEVCQKMLGYLAVIDSQMEDVFIKALVEDRDLETPYVWLGGNDLVLEGHWVWTKSNLPISYTNWCHPQQGGASNNKDCMALADASGCDWKWVDTPCTNRYSSLCEMKVPSSSLIG